jgi:lipopolysaccharide kinase (Kdo/WaaP) family protein
MSIAAKDCRVSNHSRFASDEIQRLFAANGIRDLEDAFLAGEPLGEQHHRRANRHHNKVVVKVDLKGTVGVTPVYIKRQWSRERWLPRPTDIRHRINLQCSPVHEWRGLQILKNAGVHVSEPLALFWSGWGLTRGAVVTRAVPPQHSIADLISRGDLERLPAKPRTAMLEAAVSVVLRLRSLRISWRSMKTKHFYPEELRDGSWRMWLIDCEGVYRWATEHDSQREWRTFVNCFEKRSPALHCEVLDIYKRLSASGVPMAPAA